MISFIEAANLSSHVYNVENSIFGRKGNAVNINKDTIITKHVDGWYRITGIDDNVTPASNFFGALYIKFHNGYAESAVVAFRGTIASNVNNIIEDIVSWYSSAMGTDWHDHLPGYYYQAIDFTFRVFEYLRANFPHLYSPARLRFTGHSLGGALAQLISLNYFPAPCVIFNSPVCRNIVKQNVLGNWKLVNNVNAHYGVINKIGGVPIGNVNVVSIPNRETEAKAMFDHFNQATFTSGTLLSQAGETMSMVSGAGIALQTAGATEHLLALGGAANAIASVPTEHAKIIDCEQAYSGEYLALVRTEAQVLREEVCNLKVVLSAAIEVIVAQHDINNMIHALSNHAEKMGGGLR